MSKSRYIMVEVVCDWCGVVFEKQRRRVKDGKKNFCTRKCCNEWQKENRGSEKIGKANATIHFDKSRGGYIAVWRDVKTNKPTSTTWAHWAWEVNFGDVPDGYVVSYKDGDFENTSLGNLYLKSPEEVSKEASERMIGRTFSKETRNKMSKSASKKRLSKEHKLRIGDASRKLWADGKFDTIHKGKYNRHWRGGVEKPYPVEFNSQLKSFIKDRDNYLCQICGRNLYKSKHGEIHHIDGNKKHNELENLVLLCRDCHAKVHAKYQTSPAILAFREQLEWNK